MDENQNFGYHDGAYSGQDTAPVQQPYDNQQYGGQSYNNQQYGGQSYDNQQYGGQPYDNQQYGGQPYDNQQYGQPQNNQQYGQIPYNQQAGPQYNQVPYGAQQQYNQQNFGQPVKAVVYDTVPDGASGTSVAALVCGILGLIFFWIPGMNIILCLAGLICAIISLVKGSGGKGMAITGLVLSIIASILTLIFFYLFALGMMFM